MTERAWIAGGLGSLALAGGALGPMSGELSRLGASACLLVLTFALALDEATSGPRRLPRVIAIGSGGALCALLAVRAPAPEGALLVCALFLAAGASRLEIAGGGAPCSPMALARGALAMLVLTLALNRTAWVWRFADDLSRNLTGWLGSASGAATSLGPSIAGVMTIALAAGFLVSMLYQERGTGRWLAGAALAWIALLVMLVWAAGVPLMLRGFNAALRWSGGPQSGMPVRGYPASVGVYLPAVLFAALLLPLLLLAVPDRRLRWSGRGPGHVALGRAAAALAAALLALMMSWPPARLAADPTGIRVTFLDRGLVSWDVPSVERRGLEQAGMFGLLPRYLASAGFQVRIDKDALTEESLAATDVAVIINPTKELEASESARLAAFVKAGGGLMVLGDHTDLEGTMAPLNAILAPYGISFRFDSAFTPRHWRNDAGFLPGPMTRDLDDANSRFQQSTGGSLRLERGAAPVALARWGFSDAGDRNNKDNAFLGDYIYQAAEPLGDLPIVAQARSGLGRVIVFGDTSAFQNNSMPLSWPFLSRVFQVAAAHPSRAAALASAVGLGGLCLLLAGCALRPERWAVAALAGSLLGMLAGAGITAAAEPAIDVRSGRMALVDACHFNDVSIDLWEGRALSGLNLNLARHGYLPLIWRDRSDGSLERAQMLVVIAPRKPYTASEVAAIRQWIESGGELILSVGWEEKEVSGSLLRMADLDIDPVPLGPVPILRKIADSELFRRLQMEPHFAKAWPIARIDPARDEVLYASDSYPIVARRRMGQGGFTLVADSRFLLNKTLEEEGAVWEGNIAFLRTLLRPRGAGRSLGTAQ